MGNVLDDSEGWIFDQVTSDLVEAGGDEVNYYSVNKTASTIDPLYGEYINRHVDGPFRLPAIPKWPQPNPITGEPGFTIEFAGICSITRVHFEQYHAPYPSENDILEMWRTPYHDIHSMGQGLFFDIIKVEDVGHVNDFSRFTIFQLTLKRRPQFGAERRIVSPGR